SGYFGILTENALKSFQSANQLSSTGVINTITTSKLAEKLNRSATTRSVFKPAQLVTRAEAAKIASLLLDLKSR
ncbi:MAG: peptidoglycan-binding domain-containing protein, partial [Candidatus Gracilibacteria bacterium]|nr:peptidoglycan-binding domain-containing protein [Candidatus Gracilibacteria bacterium]